mmetsp:Transcript_56349/g.134502  ORF Transcript_56349/g.134502 Transcript_56349/m.134502 type:complete len:221 (+) Transcript_56349:648-1310(+)
MRMVCLASMIHFFRYSLLSASPSQTNSTASKPSDSSGTVKLAMLLERAPGAMSLPAALGRNSTFSSSSVNSTLGGSSPIPSSSSSCFTSSSFTSAFGSSFASSAFSPLTSSFLDSSPAFFNASSSSFFRLSSAFLLISANSFWRRAICLAWSLCAFFSFHSLSLLDCFSLRIFARSRSLNSSRGLPITTMADFLKCGRLNLFSTSARSSATRLPRTSMTT